MKYMGSKRRISKYLLPILLNNRLPEQYYIEPFVGGANLIDKVDGNRIGNDLNKYAIGGLIAIRDRLNELPKDNTETNESIYAQMKTSLDIDIAGYYAFQLSYGGKFFGGWCRDKDRRRDYVAEGYRNAVKQSPKLKGIDLRVGSYLELELPKNSIIYCDPPYANTTSYKNKFNHEIFWDWCRITTLNGHKVYISEYIAPEDFECIYAQTLNSSLTQNTGAKTGIEKLFVYKDMKL